MLLIRGPYHTIEQTNKQTGINCSAANDPLVFTIGFHNYGGCPYCGT